MTHNPNNLPENIFQVLFENAPGSVLLKADEPNFTIAAVSDDFLKINNVTREGVLNKGFFEAFPDGDDYPHGETTAFKGFVRVVETGEKLHIPFLRYDVWNEEAKCRLPHFWTCTNVPIFGADNKVAYILKSITDITGEVKAKEATAESENRLLLAAEATGFAIWDMSIPDINFSFSSRIGDVFGHPPDTDITLSLVRDQVHPDDLQNIVMPSYYQALETGSFSFEVRITWNDGALHWVHVKGVTLFNEKNEPHRMLGTVVDITEHKRDEIRKNDFIAMASHELKTPLTSIKAYIQILERKLTNLPDPFINTTLVKANKQVNKMTALIHSFLDLSKLEPGKLQLQMEIFDINQLIKDAIAENNVISSTHSICFDHNGCMNVKADKEKINQVISNFISNAIKYSPRGSTITLHSKVDDNNVQVSVKDQGVGILQKDQDKIFQRFYRVADEDTKYITGFGIGLYVSSEIIQRHKGKIWVKSDVGKGSAFYFSLPVPV